MKNTPIYNSLIKHKRKHCSSFHTPGHKSRFNAFNKELLKLDLTEIPDTDSLFEANGPILKAEKNLEDLFSTKRTLISGGGCTLCIQTMISLCCPEKSKIIMGRIVHKSAINTLALLDVEPIWVYPHKDAGFSYPGRIDASDIKKALTENPDAKAVYLTSPDYYGVISDITAISAVCREYNVPLLVDNAHGSHLPFIDKNLDPVNCGATFVASSLHKTLPVLTGGALLHICDEKFTIAAKEAMSLFASTSPSFPIMASIDLCYDWLIKNKNIAFIKLYKKVDTINNFAIKKGISTPSGLKDPLRFCFNTRTIGLRGSTAADFFRSKKVEPEFCDEDSVVLIPTPFNSTFDFLRLKHALRDLPIGNDFGNYYEGPIISKPPSVMSPREAIFSDSEFIDTSKSIGRISAQSACPCPPGIPVVMPGEKITEQAVSFLLNYGIFTLKVVK